MLQHKRKIFMELLDYFLMKKFLFYNYMYKYLVVMVSRLITTWEYFSLNLTILKKKMKSVAFHFRCLGRDRLYGLSPWTVLWGNWKCFPHRILWRGILVWREIFPETAVRHGESHRHQWNYQVSKLYVFSLLPETFGNFIQNEIL